MSKSNMRADALAAYEAALASSSPDWRSVAALLRAAIPSTKAAPASGLPDYPIVKYKSDRVGPTCVVTFDDGQRVRMTTATLADKPLNVGRGLRNCVAAYQARNSGRTGFVAMLWGDDPVPLPAIAACHFEQGGDTIATYDPAECNRALGIN